MFRSQVPIALCAVVVACGGHVPDPRTKDEPKDLYPEVTTEHCQFTEVPATAGAGGSVTKGTLQAGAAEAPLDVPVSTALGAFTGRAGFLGDSTRVDERSTAINGQFLPSVGIETNCMVKALALSAGGENVIIIKVDLGFPYEGHLFELEERLGPSFHGKVIIAASHSHSAWGQHSAHEGIGSVGAGEVNQLVYDEFLSTFEAVARAALDARKPARIGIFVDNAFDHDNRVTHDRRKENNELAGGEQDDDRLFMIRVDGVDGTPIAAVPIFGVHGTLQDYDNSFVSADGPGAMERIFAEQFDQHVVVMHLQGISGDVSPVGHGDIDCDSPPGEDDDPCWKWLRNEGFGREAAPLLATAWDEAGADMKDSIELEMVTRSIELGPNYETMTIRDGALAYAPWDRYREADRLIWDSDGKLLSPIDEFNAPVGAALCGATYPMFLDGAMTNTLGIAPYGSCTTIDVATFFLGDLLKMEFRADIAHPVCQSTRTTVSALRIGDYVVGTGPGELTTLLGDYLRSHSPVPPDNTLLISHAQGQVGYLMTPEDWVLGGYEPSINFWGPLEGEYIGEQMVELMNMAMSPEREDAGSTGADRMVTPAMVPFTFGEPAVAPGTPPTPAQLAGVWTRMGPPSQAQPAAQIARADVAQFVWIGAHPASGTPLVTLEREVSPGSFETVTRRSGRPVGDLDILLSYSQSPLEPAPDEPLTHFWTVEWQAVPWIGSGDLDTLHNRATVPVGNYRFKVIGPSYELASNTFEVVPASPTVVASLQGTTISATATIRAAKGFRLMHNDLPSNQPIPLVGTFDVELQLPSGDPILVSDVASDDNGTVVVDAGAEASQVVSITLTDAHGNTGTSALENSGL